MTKTTKKEGGVRHKNDHTMFAVPKVVLINLETSELHLVDSASFGLGSRDEGNPLDERMVRSAGFEILGDL